MFMLIYLPLPTLFIYISSTYFLTYYQLSTEYCLLVTGCRFRYMRIAPLFSTVYYLPMQVCIICTYVTLKHLNENRNILTSNTLFTYLMQDHYVPSLIN